LLLLAVLGSATAQAPGYMRVAEEPDVSVRLELATRVLRPAAGGGPEIGLVAVAHVGDPILYEAIQDFLRGWDVVLYESVMPTGAGRPRGAAPGERRASTRRALDFVASVIEAHRLELEAYPEDLEQLLAFAGILDSRTPHLIRESLIDAWGQPVSYAASNGGFVLTSQGPEHTIRVSDHDGIPAAELDREAGVQAKLAEALGLEFQLTSLQYDHRDWICADLDMEQVEQRMAARGADFSQLRGSLSGTSAMGEMLEQLVQLIPMVDAMMGGGMVDTLKVLLIETMGNERAALGAMQQQLGEGFMEVIVEERNQAVVEVLQHVLRERGPRSIAILYGAAHMPDLEARLRTQLGYERHRVLWVPAIAVDLESSKVDRGMLRMVRSFVQRFGELQLPGAR
jgi:hypothetical protein